MDDDKAKEYLNKLMYHISTTHLDMGGEHKYNLRHSGFPLVTEIKAWLSEQNSKSSPPKEKVEIHHNEKGGG